MMKSRRWTRIEDAVLIEAAGIRAPSQIAIMLRRSTGSVTMRMSRMGLLKNKNGGGRPVGTTKDFCFRGHPRSGDNIYITTTTLPSGKTIENRQCRACYRVRLRMEQEQRRKARQPSSRVSL